MKKALFLFFALPLFTVKAHATITETKSGGGPNGYWNVKETHSDSDASLSCVDPGYSSCCWEIAPQLKVSTGTIDVGTDVDPVVQTKISKGILSGSYDLDATYIVSWKATDLYNYSMDIELIK